MKHTILIVDDNSINRNILGMIFENKYDIVYASDGDKAISVINSLGDKLSAIFLDIILPKMDGISVLKYIASINIINKVPVIMITSDSSIEVQSLAYELGASDFICKPFTPNVVYRRANNLVDLFAYKNDIEKALEEAKQEIKDTNEFLVDALSNIVEFRNLESGEHVKRVKAFTNILSRYVMENYPQYNLTSTDVDIITTASALHDVGKIGIPDSILLKPGRFTDEEYDEMKRHTIYGAELLRHFKREGKDNSFYNYAYDICRYHHERYDGNGYPDGLKGEEIPISAQIVSVADVYDALVSKRVYKNAYDMNKAFEMIKSGDCGVFSDIMINCLELAKEEIIDATLDVQK